MVGQNQEREVFVQFNVAKLKKATRARGAMMTIEFAYPAHLKASQETAERMVDKLMLQMLSGRFDDIKIKGLTLSWAEEADEQ